MHSPISKDNINSGKPRYATPAYDPSLLKAIHVGTLGIENDTCDRFTMLDNMDFYKGLRVPDHYTTVDTENSDILTRLAVRRSVFDAINDTAGPYVK